MKRICTIKHILFIVIMPIFIMTFDFVDSPKSSGNFRIIASAHETADTPEAVTDMADTTPLTENGTNSREYTQVGDMGEIRPWVMIVIFGFPLLLLILMVTILLTRKKPEQQTSADLNQTNAEVPKEVPKKPTILEPQGAIEGALRKPIDPEVLDIEKLKEKGRLNTLYHLICKQGTDTDEKFAITRYVSTMGRRSSDGRVNDIEFSSEDKKISRKQALLVYHPESDKFYIINEASVPVFVNGKPIEQAYPLSEGDEINLGYGQIILKFVKHI
jgi:hypothetical protein